MRNIFYSLVVLVAVMTSAIQVKAAHFVPEDGGTYHFVFTRYNNNLSVSERASDGVLVSADLDWSSAEQKWTVSKNGDDYTFTNGNGKIMYFKDGKFKTGVAGDFQAGEELMELRKSTNTEKYGKDAWVIAPKGNSKSMNPIGGSRPGKEFGVWHDNDGGNAVKIANPKILLDLEIPTYEEALASVKVGTNPGQVTQAVKDAFSAKIDEVKAINDNDHYAQAYIDAFATLSQAKQDFLSSVAVPQVGKIYYIQGTRPANTYITSQGAGQSLAGATVIPDKTQQWEVVANGSGFALKNVETGEYMDTEAGNSGELKSVPTMPSKEVTFVPAPEIREKQVAFYVEGQDFLLHAGNGNILNYTGGNKKDNQTWIFFDVTEAAKKFLKDKIEELTNIKTNTPLGDDFGQYSQSAKDALQTAIDNAQAVYDNASATQTEIDEQMTALKTALDTYKQSINADLGTLAGSDASKYRWYTIRNTATHAYCRGKVMTSNGSTDKFKFEDSNGSDEQLFRFEVVGDKVMIINKANGKYVGQSGAVADAGVEFALNLLEDAYSFNIKQDGVRPLHAQGHQSLIVDWNGGAGTASAWVFDFVKEEDIPNPVNLAVELDGASTGFGTVEIVGQTGTTVNTATPITIKAVPKPGHIFVKWTDGTNEITEPNYTYTGKTDVTFTATFKQLGKGTVLSPTELDKKYFYIQSACDGAHGPNKGDFRNNVLYADGTAEGKLKHGANDTDFALWFIEDGKLKNKGSQMFMTGSHSQDVTGADFTSEAVGSEGQVQMKAGVNSYTCAWANNLADRYSSQGESSTTAWYFILESDINTSVNTINGQNISIFVTNGILNVEGVDNFSVFTIAGQRVNTNQMLQSGVYVVKANNFVQKVVVK